MTIPRIRAPLPLNVIRELNSLAIELGEVANLFRLKGFEIPSATLPLALILANAKLCPVCSQDYEPKARHHGEMCFLISKEGNDSLIENEQDHGLDYHLRAVMGLERQVGHFVGERLAELGFVELVALQNPRTGRSVRGMRVLRQGPIKEAVSHRILEAIEVSFEPDRDRVSAGR